MCNINGVLFTPYHPTAFNDTWSFPIDLVSAHPTPLKSWFNLILKDEQHQNYEVEFQNGVKAITLGHYRKENKVLEHPYYGTDAFLKDLQERDPVDYENEYICIEKKGNRKLHFDENHYCINYYKISTETPSKATCHLPKINPIKMKC